MSRDLLAWRTAARSAGLMLAFSLAFTAFMAFTYERTRPAIEASREATQQRLINEILPPASYDNNLLADRITLGPEPALGLSRGGSVWRARRGDEDVALIVEAVAGDGYGGDIALVVAFNRDGLVSGVRVTAHQETPGLGDYIDPAKDRRKGQPWIGQFSGARWQELTPAQWRVRRDGGDFDYRTGATISARAVVVAVGRAARWAAEHQQALFAAPAGSNFGEP